MFSQVITSDDFLTKIFHLSCQPMKLWTCLVSTNQILRNNLTNTNKWFFIIKCELTLRFSHTFIDTVWSKMLEIKSDFIVFDISLIADILTNLLRDTTFIIELNLFKSNLESLECIMSIGTNADNGEPLSNLLMAKRIVNLSALKCSYINFVTKVISLSKSQNWCNKGLC